MNGRNIKRITLMGLLCEHSQNCSPLKQNKSATVYEIALHHFIEIHISRLIFRNFPATVSDGRWLSSLELNAA